MHIGLNAHLLASAQDFRRAGIHHYIYNLIAHLPQAAPDLRATIFVGEGELPSTPYAVRRSRFKTHSPLRRILWEQLWQPFQLRGLDLMHELAFVAPLLMPRPFVVTVYDLSFMRYPERLPAARRLYLRAMTAVSCRRARRVIAISRSTAADLSRLLKVPPEKIDLAVPGVQARFRKLPRAQVEAFRAAKGLPERFFFYLGTLEPRKNLPVLLRAYATLPEADRRAVPLILGGGAGWMTAEVPRLIDQLGLAQTVHRVGYLPDAELVYWYNCAETFVYPSIFEGWGLPVVEAMACGLPPLVSNVSALPEAVGEVGMQLPPQDEQAWRAALERAMHDSAWRAEQSLRAQVRACQFTWLQTAQATQETYRKALEN
ncbi:MAG: glycosyltransferase family 1 protein [Candidatus Thermofonsia Clade 1 bacterium]|jgi:glycosyltransferase involved in cell wall biosynthesis|uniref:Glycosyltransferase family 1 protein n=1 Tax=Candidatus Thermofonsia Clade 1 bacterium TaxID=2364210 RepID=A0A2M8PEM3_9CHLR|nr:MAG: glycosyltransferase family 1 protein [Candidatus Thermofonsia Clade 1 bacterium]RMF53466.1 MAG: glycosyltransferase family 1 protein [Chloroflexota bacterium]